MKSVSINLVTIIFSNCLNILQNSEELKAKVTLHWLSTSFLDAYVIRGKPTLWMDYTGIQVTFPVLTSNANILPFHPAIRR